MLNSSNKAKKRLEKLPEKKNYLKSLEANLLQAINSVQSDDEAKENKALDNFIDICQDFEEEEIQRVSSSKNDPKNNILHRAKFLIDKSKQETYHDPNFKKSLQKKQKIIETEKEETKENNMFLTSVNAQNKIQQQKYSSQSEGEDQISDSEIQKHLEELEIQTQEWKKNDKRNKTDDLQDIWKLINETKNNIIDYAEEVVDLKKIINQCNINFSELGVDKKIFINMDKEVEEIAPKNDCKKMFDSQKQIITCNKLSKNSLQPLSNLPKPKLIKK